MAEFMGRYQYAIDHKGRTNVPAKFRHALPPEAADILILTRGLEGCLFAYPQDTWKALMERLRNLQQGQANTRYFMRTLLSDATESALDTQGRVIIPPHLLELAGLEKDALILGVMDKIEIWNPQRYEAYTKDFGISFEQVAESLLL